MLRRLTKRSVLWVVVLLFFMFLFIIVTQNQSSEGQPTRPSTFAGTDGTGVQVPMAPWLIHLQWADGFLSRTCDNPLFCFISPEVGIVVADAFAVDAHTLVAVGLYRVDSLLSSPSAPTTANRKSTHQPLSASVDHAASLDLVCSLDKSDHGSVQAKVFTTSIWTAEKQFKTYHWRGVPFSFVQIRCRWSIPVFGDSSLTYASFSGTFNVSRVLVRGKAGAHGKHSENKAAAIAACVSQFHSRPSATTMVEFTEYYRWLGVHRFTVYDFGDNEWDALRWSQLYITLPDNDRAVIDVIDWSPVQRYPSWLRGQVLAINHCLRYNQWQSSAEFILNVDLDEFLFSMRWAKVPTSISDGRLALAAQRWASEADADSKRAFVLFASFDFARRCEEASKNNDSDLPFATSRLLTRAQHPDHYSDGARSGWQFYFAGGQPRDGVGGGRGKYLVSTRLDPDIYASVHTLFGDYSKIKVIQPEIEEWRVNHYRHLLVGEICSPADSSIRPGSPSWPSFKSTFHSPADPTHEVQRTFPAIEDHSMLAITNSLRAFVRRRPSIADAFVSGHLPRFDPSVSSKNHRFAERGETNAEASEAAATVTGSKPHMQLAFV